LSATKVIKDKKEKKWVGWFRPLSRPSKHGSLLVAEIELFHPVEIVKKIVVEKNQNLSLKNKDNTSAYKRRAKKDFERRTLVISVPSSCGNAVSRNRFRRIVRARFSKCFSSELIVGDNVKRVSSPSGHSRNESTNKSAFDKVSRKGLWIRLLNRHRLGPKLRLEEWKELFDQIEARYLSL